MDASATDLILATTAEIEGRQVREYLGIVSGEAMVAIASGSGRVAGGPRHARARGVTAVQRVSTAREDALATMASVASGLGASAVVSVHVEYATVVRSNGRTLLIVTASGTAVML